MNGLKKTPGALVSGVLHLVLLLLLIFAGVQREFVLPPSTSLEMWQADSMAPEVMEVDLLEAPAPKALPPVSKVTPPAPPPAPSLPQADIALKPEPKKPEPQKDTAKVEAKPEAQPNKPEPKKPEPKKEIPKPEPQPKKETPKAEPKSESKKETPKAEPKAEPKSEPNKTEAKKTEASKPKTEAKPKTSGGQKLADDLLAGLGAPASRPAPANQSGAASGAVGGVSDEAWLNNYATLVVERVRPHVFAPDVLENTRTLLEITLLPNLEVRAVEKVHSSGNDQYDEAVIRAVWAAKQFPPLLPGMKFSDVRKIRLEFRPN